MYTTCNKKTTKNELPKSKDYSMVFFETNSENINDIGSDFLIIHFSKPNDDHICSQVLTYTNIPIVLTHFLNFNFNTYLKI